MAENCRKAPKIRRVIAEKMATSWTTMPRVAYTKILVCDEVEAFRKKRNAGREAADKIGSNTVIMYACVKALQKYPLLNGRFVEDKIITYDEVNIGLAVDTERGLMVPNVKNAQNMQLEEFSKAVNAMTAKAKSGQLELADMEAGTFTISSLGSLGVDHCTPIINYPESSILGTYSMRKVPAIVDGEIRPQIQQNLVLVSDHRLVDGAMAAKFICEVVNALEHPEELLQ